MMGKKDYQLFADAISQIEDLNTRLKIRAFLYDVFRNDNPRFDEGRFEDWVNRRLNNQTMKGTNHNPKYMPLGVN